MKLFGYLFGLSFFAVQLFACPVTSASTSASVLAHERKLGAIVNYYSDCEGVDVVKVGNMGTTLLKGVLRASVMDDINDPEARAVLSLIRDIKGVTIVDYDDAPRRVKDAINTDINALISKEDNLLMEVKDDGENMYIFAAGTSGEDLKDLVLYTPSDGALIWIKGKISSKAIARLARD